MTPTLVVDNTGRGRAGAARLHEVLTGPPTPEARARVEGIRRAVWPRVERRSRRRRWLRAAYRSGRALGALAIVAAAGLLAGGVVYGAGWLAWRLAQ
jgi:hypothetical protein